MRKWIIAMLGLCVLCALAACGAVESPPRAADSQSDPVTLTMVHWIGTEAGTVMSEINDRFHREYPGIEVRVEYAPVDQYQSIIRTRFVSGSAPDLLGIFPGKWQEPFVRAGYLLDLSGSRWASRLDEDAMASMTTGDRLYGMPMNRNAIGVLYDKRWFREQGLALPRDWEQFLDLCETIRQRGRTPLALGLKDQWVTQILPFAMAPSAIYRDRPDFDREMDAGRASFADSPWRRMLLDYKELARRGYFNEDYLETTYEQMVQMLATGQAAMMVMGNWALGPMERMNPNLEIGMFPLPYVDGDDPIRLSSGVSIGIGASAATRHPEEVKDYLDFLSRPDINKLFVEQTQSFSIYRDVSPGLNATLTQIEPALRTGTYPFLDQNWPPGVQDRLFQAILNVMAGDQAASVDRELQGMDRVYQANRAE